MNIYAIRARLYKSSQSASLLSRAVPKGPECLFAKVGAWYERARALSKRAGETRKAESDRTGQTRKGGGKQKNRHRKSTRAREKKRASACEAETDNQLIIHWNHEAHSVSALQTVTP